MTLLSDFSKLFFFLLRHSKDTRYSRITFTLTVATSLISGLSTTALLILVNAALNARGTSGAHLGWGFLGLCLLLPTARFVSMYFLTNLTQRSVYHLRVELSERILQTPLRNLETLGAHRLLAALTVDIASITAALTLLPVLCMQANVVLASLCYLAWLSRIMFLIVIGFSLFGVVSYQLPLFRGLRFFKLARGEQDSLYGHFAALTDGIKELKLHKRKRTDFIRRLLTPTARSAWKYTVAGDTVFAATGSWGQVIFFVLIGFVLFVTDNLTTSPQALTGYVLITLYLMIPLEAIQNSLPIFSQAAIAVRKLEELGLLISSASTVADGSSPAGDTSTHGPLVLKGVTYTYRSENGDRTFTLGPVGLELRAGELVFITGGNGSGKTVLAKLLTGLYVPESGAISINGETITDINREWYLQHFSAVFSDFFLFKMLLGLESLQLDSKARTYLARFQLDNEVEVTQGLLSTTNLSQGQRKRLALIIAYLEDRPIYVLDEWAADQDPMFREIFYLQLLPELRSKGKTLVVISHDDSYYHIADRIIRMDYGTILYDRPPSSAELPGRVNDSLD